MDVFPLAKWPQGYPDYLMTNPPLTTISGFIPSYTLFSYLITKGGPFLYPVSPVDLQLLSVDPSFSIARAFSFLTQGIYSKKQLSKSMVETGDVLFFIPLFCLTIYYYNSKGELQSSNWVVSMISPEDFGVFLSLLNFIYTSTGPLSLCRTPWDI